MSRESMENFFKFLSEDRERQDKVKSFGGDMDALAAYAREHCYEFSSEELREYQDKALRALKGRMKKLRQPEVLSSLSPGARAFLEFMKLAETDEKTAGRLAELGAGSQENPGEIIAYGKEKGFTFNEEDMKAAGESILEQSDELDEEELKVVTGGDPTVTIFFLGVLSVASMVVIPLVVKLVVSVVHKE